MIFPPPPHSKMIFVRIRLNLTDVMPGDLEFDSMDAINRVLTAIDRSLSNCDVDGWYSLDPAEREQYWAALGTLQKLTDKALQLDSTPAEKTFTVEAVPSLEARAV